MSVYKPSSRTLCTTSECGNRVPYYKMLRTAEGNFCSEQCKRKHIANVHENQDLQRANQK